LGDMSGQNEGNKSRNGNIEDWEIICDADRFEKMRQNPEFIGIMRLARICNDIRTMQVIIAEAKDDGTPAYTRKLINALLLTGAMIHEAIKSIRENQIAYRDLEAYQNLQKELLKGERYNGVKNYVKTIRNQIMFHHDKEVFEKAKQEGDDQMAAIQSDLLKPTGGGGGGFGG